MFIIKTDTNLAAKVIVDGTRHADAGSAARAIHAAYQEMRMDLRFDDLAITFGRHASEELKLQVLRLVAECAVTATCDKATKGVMLRAEKLFEASLEPERAYAVGA